MIDPKAIYFETADSEHHAVLRAHLKLTSEIKISKNELYHYEDNESILKYAKEELVRNIAAQIYENYPEVAEEYRKLKFYQLKPCPELMSKVFFSFSTFMNKFLKTLED